MALAHYDQHTNLETVENSFLPQITDLVTAILTVGSQAGNRAAYCIVDMQYLQDGIKKCLKNRAYHQVMRLKK